MERLTNRTHDGHAYLVNVKDDEQEVECKSENTAQCILDSWERLADYEDTGLTPEEIAHAKDLLAAEKDGRLVTLPVGKIGDVVEWDSGNCKELFLIRGIVIYCDGTRYDLGEFMPVVTNEHICRIIPRAEAKAALNESNSTSLKPEAANG